MILFLGVIVLAIGAGYVFGGRLRRFELLQIRWWVLAPIGLLLQLVPLPNLGGDRDRLLGVGVLIGSYVLLLAFVAVNLRIAAFPLLLLGLTLNVAVITANGGMPVSRHALVVSHQAGSLKLLVEGEGSKHHLLDSGDVLTQLADVIGIGPPIDQVVSAGDVVVYAALAWVIVAVMRGRTRGLALEAGQARYLGRHRRGRGRTPPGAAQALPVGARRSGTAP